MGLSAGALLLRLAATPADTVHTSRCKVFITTAVNPSRDRLAYLSIQPFYF